VPGIATALLAALTACSGGGAPQGSAAATVDAPVADFRPEPRPTTPAHLVGAARSVIAAPSLTGLSDLTVDQEGKLWAVAERTRALIRIEPDGSDVRLVPLVGVPVRLDVEGLAWLGDGRFALGTESDDPRRTSDLLLFARLVDGGARARVERSIALDYSRWPLRPRGNQGIEGVCRAGSALVVAVESASGSDAFRFAPVAVHELATGAWTTYLVRLTTRTGKLSALSCQIRRGRGDAIDVLAVERHFGVARLIRFELPPAGSAPAAPVTTPAGPERPPPVRIAPVLVADLAELLQQRENFEGLVWDGDRDIALVVDNDWATVTGPNLLVRARLSGRVPQPPPAPAAGSRRAPSPR
jgi:hypothetical protein